MGKFQKYTSKFLLGTKYSMRFIPRVTYITILFVFIIICTLSIANLSIFSNEVIAFQTQQLEPSLFEVDYPFSYTASQLQQLQTESVTQLKLDLSAHPDLAGTIPIVSWMISTKVKYNESTFLDAAVVSENDPLFQSFSSNNTIIVDSSLREMNIFVSNKSTVFNQSTANFNVVYCSITNMLRIRSIPPIIIPAHLINITQIPISKIYISFKNSENIYLTAEQLHSLFIATNQLIQGLSSIINSTNVQLLQEQQYHQIYDYLKPQLVLAQLEIALMMIILCVVYYAMLKLDIEKEQQTLVVMQSLGIPKMQILTFYAGTTSIPTVVAVIISWLFGTYTLPLILLKLFSTQFSSRYFTYLTICIGITLQVVLLLVYARELGLQKQLTNYSLPVPKSLSKTTIIQLLLLLIALPFILPPMFLSLTASTSVILFVTQLFTVPSLFGFILYLLLNKFIAKIVVAQRVNKYTIGFVFFHRNQQKNLILVPLLAIALVASLSAAYTYQSIDSVISKQAAQDLGADIVASNLPQERLKYFENMSTISIGSLLVSDYMTLGLFSAENSLITDNSPIITFCNFSQLTTALLMDALSSDLKAILAQISNASLAFNGLFISASTQIPAWAKLSNGETTTTIMLNLLGVSHLPGLFSSQDIIVLDLNKSPVNLYLNDNLPALTSWIKVLGSNRAVIIQNIKSVLETANIEFIILDYYTQFLTQIYAQIFQLSLILAVLSLLLFVFILFLFASINRAIVQNAIRIFLQQGFSAKQVRYFYAVEFYITLLLAFLATVMYFYVSGTMQKIQTYNIANLSVLADQLLILGAIILGSFLHTLYNLR